MRSFTSVVILKKEFACIVGNDLRIRAEAIRDTTQIVEYMRTESESVLEILRTGSSPAQVAAILETFIRSTMEKVTDLASLVTDSDAVGKLATAQDSTTTHQFPRTFRLDDDGNSYMEGA